jgi:hypothetical protein
MGGTVATLSLTTVRRESALISLVVSVPAGLIVAALLHAF